MALTSVPFKTFATNFVLAYHFAPTGDVNPYIGAGVNYTNISAAHLLGGKGGLESNSFGLSLQAGVDFKSTKLVLQYRRQESTNCSDKPVEWCKKISAVKVDPVLVGVGFCYRFDQATRLLETTSDPIFK